MAVFGFQLLLTIVVLSLLNKFSFRYSFARWLLTKGDLIHYLHPSNEKLKETINAESKSDGKAVGKNSGSSRKSFRQRKSRKDDADEKETFNVPRNLTLSLECEPLSLYHLVQLPYYNELQWLIDFSLCTVIIYLLTEVYFYLFPAQTNTEYNLSIVWCLLSLGFVIKVLFSITGMYFRGGDDAIGERSMCIVSGCLFFLVSMVVLIADEELLEFGLVDAYRSFSKNALLLLESQGVIEQAYGPSSFLMLKFWLAIWCAFIGTFFTFPGLRVAKMHKDALHYAEGNRFLQTLYNMTFISPLFIVLFWIKPIARNYLTIREWPNRGVLMSNETFESVRLLFILAVIGFRLAFFRRYLQAYLNIAPQKLTYIRRETGRISNVDLQKAIARISYLVCVAALQLVAPILLCLFITLLTKSTGDYSWSITSIVNSTSSQFVSQSTNSTGNITETVNGVNSTTLADSIDAQLTLQLLRNVFNPIVLRGLTGFMLWWSSTTWFATTTIGFVYHTYFESK